MLLNVGEVFQIEFRGLGLSTLSDIVDALEALHTIGQVIVFSDGSFVIYKEDNIQVQFLTEHGTLDLMRSTGPMSITKIFEGEAPYCSERQAIYCNADGGYVMISFKKNYNKN